MAALLVVIYVVPFIAPQAAPALDLVGQLDAIHRQYLAGPDIGGLVALDGRIRRLLHEPWKRAGRSIDGNNFRPAWSAIPSSSTHWDGTSQSSHGRPAV